MANFGFVKCSRQERLKFFQSSLPYLNNNSLVSSTSGKAKKWSSEEPHATNQSFLTFKNGHYGIYFTLFNHELRKKDHDSTRSDSNKFIIIVREIPQADVFPEFSITKAKQDTHHDVNWLKTVSRNLLSTTSLVRQKCNFGQVYQTRGFSTTPTNSKEKPSGHLTHHNLDTQNPSKPKPEEYNTETEKSSRPYKEDEEPFEANFLRTQVSHILQAYENHRTADDLNIIYPLYQSLKRNDIILPSIVEYNIVLKSVSMRSLDSEDTVSATEERLTCLLTVYQDILEACQTKAACQPNSETYQTVLSAIFKTSKHLLSLKFESQEPRHTFQYRVGKVSEFCHVGTNLYTSLSHEAKATMHEILPELLYCVNHFPSLLNKRLVNSLLESKDHGSSNAEFYTGFISLANHLGNPHLLNLDKRALYNYISGVFDSYKKQCLELPSLADAEYCVYSAMIRALISSGNYPIATKFLDDITISFKDDLLNMKVSEKNVGEISRLISDYLQALMDLGTTENLEKAHSLLKVMREVSYLPDVKATVYNDMICRYVSAYIGQEKSKHAMKTFNETNRAQEAVYHKIWDLYNYVAIRKDFVQLATAEMSMGCSTEMLLSLTIDLGDSPNIFRLVKEVLMRNLVIHDWTVLKKLCHFLSKQHQNGESYHYEVMCEILESQASLLGSDSAKLNDFLSEHVSYFFTDESKSFAQIMNSLLVRDAFEKVNPQKDNLHGLTTVLVYLQDKLNSTRLTRLESAKVLTYQACMINGLEDTDNHYLEFPSEFMAFQLSLKNSFKKLVSKESENKFLTGSVLSACINLGLNSPECGPEHLSHLHYQRDLVPYLNANGVDGIKRFINTFNAGYNFTDETWNTIISRSFANSVLEPGRRVSISRFVERLISLGSYSSCIQHLLSLISLQNDKVNIELLKLLISRKHDSILSSSKILNALARFSQHTKNQYFLALFSQEFVRLAKLNDRKDWMVDFFKKLNSVGKSLEVYSFISQNFDFFNKGVDIGVKGDEMFLEQVLVAYMKSGKEGEINEIFNYHFSGQEQQKLLLRSDNILPYLLDYYVSVGSYEMVIQKFGKLADRSPSLKQSVQFTNFLLSLKGVPCGTQVIPDKNVNTFALALLQENNLNEMRNLYEKNKDLIRNKEMFFNILIDELIKAARLLDNQYMGKVIAKFEAVIKFCKVIHLGKLSAKTLSNLVDFLTTTKSRNLLNILFNKFLINDSLIPTFNFYFLEVELQSEAEVVGALESFEAGFKKIGDILNLQMVEDFKAKT